MWFENAFAVSDGIKCYPTLTTTNTYDTWGPIRDVEAFLHLPNERAVLSAYQLSTDLKTPTDVVTDFTRGKINGFHQNTATFIQGDNAFLSLHGAWARNMIARLHYFNIQYRASVDLSNFTDCAEKYSRNNNLIIRYDAA